MAGEKTRPRPSHGQWLTAACERALDRSTFVREKTMRNARIQRHARRFRVQSAMRVFSLVLVGMVALAVTAAAAAAAGRADRNTSNIRNMAAGGPDLRGAVEQIFALGNQARAQAGVAKLAWDPALAAAALQHCRMMAAEGPISHQLRRRA